MEYMAIGRCRRFHLLLLVLLQLGSGILEASIPLGINYGQIANNLLSPEQVIPLLQSISVGKVKLYDADPKVLRAFANTGVQFVVGISNDNVAKMRDLSKALAWVKMNVQSYLPETKITCITVGNEVLSGNDMTLMNSLLPAMQCVHAALVSLGLDRNVSVTTAHSLAILSQSYPPSAGLFRSDLIEFISPILKFHSKTGSPFLINVYPFFAYKADPKQVPLDFVLFESKEGNLDPRTNLRYDNMLFAQIDAVYSALEAQGHGRLPVQISETGWPSKGDEDEAGATIENAKKYNGNLMKLVVQKKGTPKRPGSVLDVYVFALFNENMKPGPISERNYGLFKPDGTPAYHLEVNGSMSGGSTGGVVGDNVPSDETVPTGYLTISSASKSVISLTRVHPRLGHLWFLLILFILH